MLKRSLQLLLQLFAVALTGMALNLSGAGFFNDLIKSASAIFPVIASTVSGIGVPDSIVVSGATVVLGMLVMLLSGAAGQPSAEHIIGPKILNLIDLVLAALFVVLILVWFRIMFAQEEFFTKSAPWTMSAAGLHLAFWVGLPGGSSACRWCWFTCLPSCMCWRVIICREFSGVLQNTGPG